MYKLCSIVPRTDSIFYFKQKAIILKEIAINKNTQSYMVLTLKYIMLKYDSKIVSGRMPMLLAGIQKIYLL